MPDRERERPTWCIAADLLSAAAAFTAAAETWPVFDKWAEPWRFDRDGMLGFAEEMARAVPARSGTTWRRGWMFGPEHLGHRLEFCPEACLAAWFAQETWPVFVAWVRAAESYAAPGIFLSDPLQEPVVMSEALDLVVADCEGSAASAANWTTGD